MIWHETSMRDFDHKTNAAKGSEQITQRTGLHGARKLLEREEWTCVEGKTYRIYPWENGVWKCVRADGVDKWKSSPVWYDQACDVVWWGYEKRYFFNPNCPADEPGKINWYSVESSKGKPKVRFSLYADVARALSCARGNGDAGVGTKRRTVSPTNSDTVSTTSGSDSPLQWSPPPGLEPPSGLDLAVCSRSREPSVSGVSCDDEETSAGYTTCRSDSSEAEELPVNVKTFNVSDASNTSAVDGVASPATTLNADAPSFVPILSPLNQSDTSSKHATTKPELSERCSGTQCQAVSTDGSQSEEYKQDSSDSKQNRTPLKPQARLFKPALPFMPSAVVANAWVQQGYPGMSPAAAGPLLPGRQRNGTAAQVLSLQQLSQ